MAYITQILEAIKRGEDLILVDGKGDQNLRPSIQTQRDASSPSVQAVDAAIHIGTGDGARQLLAQPKNRPYYRQFAKTKF